MRSQAINATIKYVKGKKGLLVRVGLSAKSGIPDTILLPSF